MKKCLSVFTLALTLASTSAFAAAKKYDCKGDGSTTKGNVSLTVDGDAVTVEGQFTSDDFGQKEYYVNCTGDFTKKRGAFSYYETNYGERCAVHYARVQGNGKKLALVNKLLGDSHDFSGYAYAYFVCEEN